MTAKGDRRKIVAFIAVIACSLSMCNQQASSEKHTAKVSSAVLIQKNQDSLGRVPKKFIPGAACCKGGTPSRAMALANQR